MHLILIERQMFFRGRYHLKLVSILMYIFCLSVLYRTLQTPVEGTAPNKPRVLLALLPPGHRPEEAHTAEAKEAPVAKQPVVILRPLRVDPLPLSSRSRTRLCSALST